MKIKQWLTILAACLLTFSLFSPPAQALETQSVSLSQEETAISGGKRAASLLQVDIPASADAPKTARPQTPGSDYIKDFPFAEDLALKGIFQRSGFYIRISDYWDVQYALAKIEFRVSPLITGEVPASLTFFINDVPIDSCRVNYADGAVQVTYVSIPVEMLKEDYNEFAVSSFVQAYDEEGCLDDFSGANWIIISKSSSVEVGFNLIDTGHKLCFFPYPLLSPMDEDGSELTVYVPDEANEEELGAAFMLRAGLSNATGDEDRISLKYLSAYSGQGNALIVSLWRKLPYAVQDQRPSMKEDLSAGAMVYGYGTEDGNVLVVTSNVPVCLTEGAAMLMDADRLQQEKQNWAFIREGMQDQVITNRAGSSLISNGETIKEVTGSDGIEFIGPFHQEAIVYLPFSGGFILGEGGKISLLMRYSDNLDFDRSLVTVYWGNIPVASKKLEREKATADLFSFTMPADVVGTHAASLKIAFELEVKELYCTKRSDEMPWAFVSGDSTLYLPSGSGSAYDLSLRPYPFLNLGEYNHLAVVVPERMSSSELSLLGRIAALYGGDASPYGDFHVFFAPEFSQESAPYHIITLGTWRDNVLIRAINDYLPFRFDENGSRFLGNEQLVLGDSYAESVGMLQIIDSPWQEGKAILAVCGVDDEALEQINEFCSVQKNNWTLAGDTFLIDTDLDTMSFRFLKERAEEEFSVVEKLEQHRDAVILTLISSASMLILLVCVIIALARFRKNRKEEAAK